MSQSKKSTSKLSLKALEQENKVLGNIIRALKSHKHLLEVQNGKLQCDVQQISAQQTRMQSENQALRSITAELQKKLQSLCDHEAQPPHLEPVGKTDAADLVSFLKDTSERLDRIHSHLHSAEMQPTPTSSSSATQMRVYTNSDHISTEQQYDNEVHCLQQEIHKLEMEKVELIKHNQQFAAQLHQFVNEQQSVHQKLAHVQSENMRLRQHMMENSTSVRKFKGSKRGDHDKKQSLSFCEMRFEDIIKEVARIEEENKCRTDMKQQLVTLHEEVQRLREEVVEKEDRHQSLDEKYKLVLQQYQYLCQKCTV